MFWNRRKKKFRVIVFQGKKRLVAQCIEFNLATQADTLEDVPLAFFKALESEVQLAKQLGQEPFTRLPAAHERYERMWEEGEDLFVQPFTVPAPAAVLGESLQLRQAPAR